MKAVIRHLRRAALLQEGRGTTDERLLEMFVAHRDDVAFEALMRRHGPMVLGVCQRMLRNAHDAEDAFQATFLVLLRKAASLRSRALLPNWLYGVAYRTAMKARAMNAKRRRKESQAGEVPHAESSTDEELLAQLDHELNRLPDKYRVPVILCELEGKSRKEAARLLGVPEGTLSWRLAQAKKLLAKRLSRHELAIPMSVLAVGLSPTLRASTLQSVLTAGAVPAKVLALSEGILKAMLLSKLKITACAAAIMLVAGVGVSGLTYRATAQSPRTKETLASRSQADDLEALRLEIDALHKSLQATRERVKSLEGEVGALKQQRQGPQGIAPGRMQGGPPGGMKGALPGSRPGGREGRLPGQDVAPGRGTGSPSQDAAPQPGGAPPQGGGMRGMKGMGGMGGMGGMMQKAKKSDPVTDAETALKKLRTNPGDKRATEALEQALQRLKEREAERIRRMRPENSARP